MRKRLLILILALVVGASGATGVSASTDCERWIGQYKTALAQSRAAKQALAAKRRLRAYAHRKLAQYSRPKPVHKPVFRPVAARPRLSPGQMLRRYDLLCGVLPEEALAKPMLIGEDLPPFLPGAAPDGLIDYLVSPATGVIGGGELPAMTSGEVSTPVGGPIFGPMGGPIFGGGPGTPGTPGTPTGPGIAGTPTGPGTPVTPGTPTGTGTPGTPGTPILVGAPETPAPPGVVPEPSSVAMVLTGMAGLAEMLRRRSLS